MPNAVQYAENDLGVHSVYEEAERRLNAHDAATDVLAEALHQIRLLRSEIAAMERDIVSYAATLPEYSSLSKTAFRDAMKDAVKGNERMIDLQQKLSDAEQARDDAEIDVKHHALAVGLATARLNELGGLLQFYAASKLVQLQDSQPQVTHVSGQGDTRS
jgi:hypothetical protein